MIKYSRCKEENCDKYANYNLPDQKSGLYCSSHKKENMIDIKHKRCIENICDKRANFNLLNEKDGIYCKNHKKENMINIYDKKCIEKNCNKIPSFNLPNSKTPIYCGKHKKENMINIKTKKCIDKNCNKQANFNLPNKKSRLYCLEHKKQNMINVISKQCIQDNCYKQPSCNFIDKKIGLYCSEHKKENMINVISRKCIQDNCTKEPIYNIKKEKRGIYCNKHKKENMINIKDKRCLEYECDIFVKNKKYKGYCLRCFIFKFPNEKISKNYKVKENHMTDFLKEEFKDEIMVFDKTVGGCSLRRPDVYIDKYTHVLIIECDENQHSGKEYTNCDTKRTMEIFQDFGNRPLVYIRFNPDSYINNENKKVLSSFKIHKTLFVPVIRVKKEWANRLNVLKETINKWLIKIVEKEVTNEYLFYDKKL